MLMDVPGGNSHEALSDQLRLTRASLRLEKNSRSSVATAVLLQKKLRELKHRVLFSCKTLDTDTIKGETLLKFKVNF